MTRHLVSAYAASRLLEKDRQTIERATRSLEPDGYERGKPRWRLARIVHALNARAGRNNGGAGADLERRFAELEKRYDAVRTAPTLDERRQLAPAFFAFLADTEDMMTADARQHSEDPRLTSFASPSIPACIWPRCGMRSAGTSTRSLPSF